MRGRVRVFPSRLLSERQNGERESKGEERGSKTHQPQRNSGDALYTVCHWLNKPRGKCVSPCAVLGQQYRMRLSSPRARASSSRRRWITSSPSPAILSFPFPGNIVNPPFRNEIFSFRRINLFVLTSIPLLSVDLSALSFHASFRAFQTFPRLCLQDYSRVRLFSRLFSSANFFPFLLFLRKEGKTARGSKLEEYKGECENERGTRR